MEEILFGSLQPTSLGIRDLAQVHPEIYLWSCLFIGSVLKQPVIWHSIKSQIICFNWHCPEAFGKIWDLFIMSSHSGYCNQKWHIVEYQMVMGSLRSGAALGRAANLSLHLSKHSVHRQSGIGKEYILINYKAPPIPHLFCFFSLVSTLLPIASPSPLKAGQGGILWPGTCEDLS